MENNLYDIGRRITGLVHELYPFVSGLDGELLIINTIAEELLPKFGKIEKPDEVVKALSNMFMAGQVFTNKDKAGEPKFTVAEFKNYVNSKDSLGDVAYYLTANAVAEANNK